MLKYFAIVSVCSAILLFASLALMLVFFSSQKPEPDNRDQPTAAENRRGHSGDAQTNEGANQRDSKGQHKRDWYYTFVDRPTDWLLVLFNGLLVLATVALFVSGERAVETAQKASDAANRSADAAKQSADVANLALTIGERAFVMPIDLPLFWHTSESGEIWWEMSPIWANAGNTRTEGLRINVNSYFEADPLPADYSFPLHPGPSVDLFIGPKAKAGGDPIVKTGAELAAVRAGEKYFYIWGSARYREVFPGTPEHITRFAWQVFVFGDATRPGDPPNVVRITTKLLPRHNCADDECARQGFP